MFNTIKYIVYGLFILQSIALFGPVFIMMVPMMIGLIWSFFGVPPQELATIAQWGFDHGIWNSAGIKQ